MATTTATQPTCGLANGSIAVTPNNATNYAWTGALTGANPTNIAAGTYTVTVTAADGCTATASVTINTSVPLVATLTSANMLTCTTTSSTLSASGGTNYDFGSGFGNISTQTVTTAGIYTVTVRDANGCTASTSVTITADITAPTPNINGNLRFCAGSTSALTAAGGTTYLWSANVSTSTGNGATIANSGIYSVTATSANGCTATTTIYAVAVVAPTVSAGRDTIITAGSPVILNGSTSPTSGANLHYYWLPVAAFANNQVQQPILQPTQTSTYTFYVVTPEGCESNRDEIIVGIISGCLLTNEGFTPNGDGKNDTWELPCLYDLKNTLSVYNRWGQLVFRAANYVGGWNGYADERALPDGTYYYVIKVTGSVFTGTVSILR